MKAKPKIGITSTVPIEIILAAGLEPVDLNNVFIGSDSPLAMVALAEDRGFPGNSCAWIKGMYGAANVHGVKRVLGVTRGDCTNSEKLLEIWRHDGLKTDRFAFPDEPDEAALASELERLARALGPSLAEAEKKRLELLPLRRSLEELDRMTWQDGLVSGAENHLWLVGSSDFGGNPERFHRRLIEFMEEAKTRTPRRPAPRLGYLGVPPIAPDLYEFIEGLGAGVVFNEVQRQFSMPGDRGGLAAQYAAYTYPYDTAGRVRDIKREIEKRNLAGLVHYAQTFCPRRLESILLEEILPAPVITIEADKPGPLEARTKTRLEAFIEGLKARHRS